ncbi:hypothetical protein GCM10023157_10100 [Gluconacetobacter asukensis]
MTSFRDSRFYGSRVDAAKAEKGWLSEEEFIRLGQHEYQDYRQTHYACDYRSHGMNVDVGGVFRFVVILAIGYGLLELLVCFLRSSSTTIIAALILLWFGLRRR